MQKASFGMKGQKYRPGTCRAVTCKMKTNGARDLKSDLRNP